MGINHGLLLLSLNLFLKKNKYYKKWLCSRTEENLMRYKMYKNKLTCIIRASEKLYYKNKFLENKNSLKNTWSLINEFINAPKTECCIN